MLTNNQLCEMRKIVESQFMSSDTPAGRQRAEKFLTQGVISSPLYPDVSFSDTELWADRNARSHERYLNGFLFLADWYGTILKDRSSTNRACSAASEVVRSWASNNRNMKNSARMAFHDETTAQRLINLLQLDSFVAESIPEESTKLLRPLMDETAAILSDVEFHSSGNNHGMFQDLALLYYSILADWAAWPTREGYMLLALRRLKDYFSTCFTSEGVHVENTPQYHVMVSRHLSVVRRIVGASEHSDAGYYETLLKKAELYATHALMPNGLYPPISDTAQRSVNNTATLGVFRSPEFLYAASTGKSGTPPQDRILSLPKSGYLVYRSAWGDPRATYAFFSAAYNADYHKHSDDLSLYVRSEGIELLAESGPYSYDYKDPFSRYAYSQFSHNSLVVDGVSLPRTDSKSDSVELKLLEKTANSVIAEGKNARYEDVVHLRRLEINDTDDGTEIDVTDQIRSNNDHAYQLLWNLGTEVTSVVHGQGFELFHGTRKVMELTFSANVPTHVSVHKGRTKPRPLGWTFPRFGEATASEVVSVEFQGKDAEIRTSIRFSNFLYTDRQIKPEMGWKRHNGSVPVNYLLCPPASGTVDKLVVVFTAIHKPGDFTYNYKSTVDRVGVAALYILDDFGDQGSYYYADHRSTAIFDSVQSLIERIALSLNITKANVATAGSSKGGAAALIHGLALGVDRIIVGAPQTRIGTFLSKPHPNILSFMAGGVTNDDVAYLDSIIPSLMKEHQGAPQISVVVGDADHHLKYHVRPLIDDAKANGVEIVPVVLPGLSHAEIGGIFRQYLRANLDQWVRGASEPALPYSLSADSLEKSISVELHSPADSTHSYRLYLGSELIRTQSHSPDRYVEFKGLQSGRYRVRISTQAPDSNSPTSFTTRWALLR